MQITAEQADRVMKASIAEGCANSEFQFASQFLIRAAT